jgi:hypothetical protein
MHARMHVRVTHDQQFLTRTFTTIQFLVKYHATPDVNPFIRNPPVVPWEQIRPNVTETLFVNCVKQ